MPVEYHSTNEFIILYFVSFAIDKNFIRFLDELKWARPIVVRNKILQIIKNVSLQYNTNKNASESIGSDVCEAIDNFLNVSDSIQQDTHSRKNEYLIDWYKEFVYNVVSYNNKRKFEQVQKKDTILHKSSKLGSTSNESP